MLISSTSAGRLQVRQIAHSLKIHLFPVVLGLLCFLDCPSLTSQQDNLKVFSRWRQYAHAPDMLYNGIVREAYAMLDDRDREIASLRTARQWRRYRETVRSRLEAAFGPLWEKTPLEARVVDRFVHQGIEVEKIIFESRPGYHVTAAFFKREGAGGRLPAVLYVCGHTADGFRAEAYQRVILNLAAKGFAVLAIDPAGQGERYQYFDPELGESRLGGTTREHSYAGLQMLLIGRSMAASRLWDGIRAVDYLVGRADVDPDRIAVQGRSGGGTMSSYLGAMDPRFAAVAPECYLTSFRRLLQSIGPQDAEQNLLSQIASGLDHGDFLIARAPKPTLMVTTTRDMFSIQGARETFAQTRPAFDALGSRDNLQMVEDNAPHQSTRANREKVYAFFMRHLGVEGSHEELDLEVISPVMLQVSQSGQVITSGSRTIHELTLEDAAPLIEALERSRQNDRAHREQVRRAAARLSGFRTGQPDVPAISVGTIDMPDYSVEKVIIDPDGVIPLPALLFIPAGQGPFEGLLWLDHRGKDAAADSGGAIEALVGSGRMVLAVDLPGTGELSADPRSDDSVIRGVSYNLVFGAQLIGSSVTGIQASAVDRALRYLLSRPEIRPGGVGLAAHGATGPAALHAAALGSPASRLALIGTPLSWQSLVEERWYDESLGATAVPSALPHYDLPDLAGLFAPRRLLVLDPLGGDGKPAGEEPRGRFSAAVSPFYRDSPGHFMLSSEDTPGEAGVARWLDKAWGPAR